MTIAISAKEKVRHGLNWVRTRLPIAVPVVLANWKVVEDTSGGTSTAKTDGKTLWYNPKFVDKLTLGETAGLILHEAGHPLYGHPLRFRMWLAGEGIAPSDPRARRMHKLHNIAADLAVNSLFKPLYIEAGGKGLIDKGCFPRHGKYAGYPEAKSLDYYLAELLKENPPPPAPPPPPPAGPDSNKGEDKGEGEDEEDNSKEGGEDDASEAKDGSDEGGEGEDTVEGAGDDPEGNGEGAGGDDEGEGDGDDGAEDEGGDGQGEAKGEGAEGKGDGEGEAGGGCDLDHLDTGVFGEFDPTPIDDEGEGEGEGDPKARLESLEEMEREWKAAVASAVVMNKSCGSGRGDSITESLRQEALVDKPDASGWIVALQRFLTRYAPGGFTFNRLSRRHGWRTDIIMPANQSLGASRGLMIVDTSGSMGDAECDRALVEMERVMQRYPRMTIKLVTCDTAIVEGKEYGCGDFPIRDHKGWTGRGGTNLAPAFLWAKGYRPDWVVVVTDMGWNYEQAPDPGAPVFWLQTVPQGGDPEYATMMTQRPVPFGILEMMPPAPFTGR